MQHTTEQFKKQLPRNIFFQIFSFLIRFGIGVWLVPFLVFHLGRAAYGLIPIAAMMTEYVNIISQSISGAVSRYLTIAIQQNNINEANRIFNTAFFSYLALALIQIPIFILIISNSNKIFTIPNELFEDAIILFTCSATAFLINLATAVFGVPIYALNRLDLTRSIEIYTQILRLAGIISLFLIFQPALRFIGYVDLSVRIIACALNVIIGKRTASFLKLNISDFDWKKIRQLTTMGGWLIVNYVGFLLFLRIDVWICNRFISAEAAGEYAALLPWSNNIRQGAQLIAGVISPMVLIYYARSEINNLIRLNNLSVRLFSLIFAIPISILCVFSSPLISLWLGQQFTYLAPLMVIMISHLVINLGVTPLFSIQTALNKVKWPAIVTLVLGVINFIMALFFTKYLGWGTYGVAIASAIVLTFKNALFTPIYTAVILNRPWYLFLKPYVIGISFFIMFSAFGFMLNFFFKPHTWINLISLTGAIGIAGLLIIWFFISKEEQKLLINILPNRFKLFLLRFSRA